MLPLNSPLSFNQLLFLGNHKSSTVITDEELKQLIESNARTAQAMLDSMAEARLERQELREGIIRLQDAVERLVNVQEGVANLLTSLDSDRPTILRKLNSIENKVDRLLQQNQEDENLL